MHNVLNITKVSLLPSLKGFDTLVGAAHAFNLAPVFIPIVDLIIRPHICPDSVWCRPLQREWLAPGGLVTTSVNLYSAGYKDSALSGWIDPNLFIHYVIVTHFVTIVKHSFRISENLSPDETWTFAK